MKEDSPVPSENTKHNSVLQTLRREGPSTTDELPRRVSSNDKQWVGKFDVTRSGTGATKSRGRTVAVYYLYGDERRAVRKYIRENTEFVTSCMQDKSNPISVTCESYWWQMFCEEWTWGDYPE